LEGCGWNGIEAAFFIINALTTLNTSAMESSNMRLVHHIITIPNTSNPLLINTATYLIGNLSDWLYSKDQLIAMRSCAQWLLNLPPYESILLALSGTLEKLTSKFNSELADSFGKIRGWFLKNWKA
jgi:hypothetical protein